MKRLDLMLRMGTVLYKLRSDKMVRQREVAIGVNMDVATYSRTEKGQREPSLVETFMFAEYYGLVPSTLIEMIQHSPAELDKMKQLQFKLEEALKENKFLKDQMEAEIRKVS